MKALIELLKSRNLIADVTHKNLSQLLQNAVTHHSHSSGSSKKAPVSVYCGFDPTAPSLHVGNLIQLLILKQFQQQNIRPIVLVGGATGMVGDPSGKNEERVLLSQDQVEENLKQMQSCVSTVLDMDHPVTGAKIINNYDWHSRLNCVDWLREIGPYFRVNSMLSKESVKRRLDSDQGISFLEFSYQLFQAYDFLHLFREENCVIQIGGSDQWGNITAGMDLIRKSQGQDAYGLTIPLLQTSSGEKFGKSAGNAIWLDSSMTSVYHFYQYFYRTEDLDIEQALKTFTWESEDAIQHVLDQQQRTPEQRPAQKYLAESITAFVHGPEGLARALETSAALFGEGPRSRDEEARQMQALLKTLVAQSTDPIEGCAAPLVKLSRSQLEHQSLLQLVHLSGICSSKAEVKRLLKSGGLYLNNRRIRDGFLSFNIDTHCLDDPSSSSSVTGAHDKWLVLRSGKRNHLLVQIVMD